MVPVSASGRFIDALAKGLAVEYDKVNILVTHVSSIDINTSPSDDPRYVESVLNKLGKTHCTSGDFANRLSFKMYHNCIAPQMRAELKEFILYLIRRGDFN